MTTGARGNSHHLAVGLCILLLGVLLILDRLGIVGAQYTLRYWPVGLVIIGASVMFQAYRGDPATNAAVPWGAIFWLFIIGFAMSHVFERRAAARGDSSSSASIFSVMGGSLRTPATFTHGDLTTVMGGARLDLRMVDAKPGERMILDVFTLMGGAVIYVPDNWNIDMQAMSMLGGIDDHRRGEISGGIGRIGNDNDTDTSDQPDNADTGRPRHEASSEASRETFPETSPEKLPDAPKAGVEKAVEKPVEKSVDGPVEAENPPATPPTLVIRGYVTLGGLQIKSR